MFVVCRSSHRLFIFRQSKCWELWSGREKISCEVFVVDETGNQTFVEDAKYVWKKGSCFVACISSANRVKITWRFVLVLYWNTFEIEQLLLLGTFAQCVGSPIEYVPAACPTKSSQLRRIDSMIQWCELVGKSETQHLVRCSAYIYKSTIYKYCVCIYLYI